MTLGGEWGRTGQVSLSRWFFLKAGGTRGGQRGRIWGNFPLPSNILVDLEARLVPSNDLLLLTAHSDFQTFHHLCFCVPRLYKSNAQEHLKSLKLINWIKGNKSENVFFCFCSIHNSKVIINILLGRTVWVWFCDKTEEMN